MHQIPFFDLRNSSPLEHAIQRADHVRRLRDACLRPAPSWGLGALRPIDAMARRWLLRTGSPYADEVSAMQERLGFAGVAAINMSYQYGCTTGVAPAR